jgi:hypothetical protein
MNQSIKARTSLYCQICFIYWDIMPCSLLKINQGFGGTWHLHLQAQRISQARKQCQEGSSKSNPHVNSSGLYGKKEAAKQVVE